MMKKQFLLLFVALLLATLSSWAQWQPSDVCNYSVAYSVPTTSPQDNRGLALSNDGQYLYLGYNTGTTFRMIELSTGNVVNSIAGDRAKNIAVDDQGRVYETGFDGEAVKIYNSDLTNLLYTINITAPRCEGIAVARESGNLYLYATSRSAGTLWKYMLSESGINITAHVLSGLDGDGVVNIPMVSGGRGLTGVVVGTDGKIYISDPGSGTNGRINRINSDGTGLTTVALTGAVNPYYMIIISGQLFVTEGAYGTFPTRVAVINLSDMSLAGFITPPWSTLGITSTYPDMVSGIAALPDGSGFYVTHENGSAGYNEPVIKVSFPVPPPVKVTRSGAFISGHNTIQAAIDAVTTQNGDVIEVSAGTYPEIVTINKSLTLLGAQANVEPVAGGRTGGESIIQAGNHPSIAPPAGEYHSYNGFVIGATDVEINGFACVGSSKRGIADAGVSNGTVRENVKIKYNWISTDIAESNYSGIILGLNVSSYSATVAFNDFEISHNLISNAGKSAIAPSGGIVYNNLTITHNDISCTGTEIAGRGIFAGGAPNGLMRFNDAVISNNNFHDITDLGINIVNQNNAIISNNVFTNVGAGAYLAMDGGTISGNTISGLTGTGYGFKLTSQPSWTPAVNQDVTITGNSITYTDAAVGLVIDEYTDGTQVVDAASLTVQNNSFLASGTAGLAIQNIADGNLPATCNWFGSTDATEITAAVSGNVTYSPYNISAGGPCTGFLPIETTIETPSTTTCGNYDIDVTVRNFTNVANISLKLKILNPALHYNGITPNLAFPANSMVANVNTTGDLFSLSYIGDGITLPGVDEILFTMHFDLLPAASGGSANLDWDTQYARCQYSSPLTDVYEATFNNLSWTLPVRPVKNTTTLKEFCTIQAAINDVATQATHTLEVDAALYNASEQVLVNKEVKIKGVNGQPTVNFLGTVSGKPTLFDISANNVTIENIHFNVDLAKLKSAIIASAAVIDNITIINNLIDCYGTPSSGTYSDRNAVSINYVGNTNYRVATGGVDNITYTGNTVNGTPPSSFRAGIAVDEGGGTFSGNTLKTINHDIIIRFGSNGPVNITNNAFNGGGVELADQNAAAGTFTISGNTFTGGASDPTVALLRVKNNYNSIPHIVSLNTFNYVDWAVSLENMNSITLNENTFSSVVATAHAVVVNTKSITTNSSDIVQVPIGAIFTNNNFNGTGTALTFQNHDSDNDSYGTITIGTAGNENNFAATLSSFIKLDGQSGSSDLSTTFPNYPVIIGTGGTKTTTMATWDQDLNAQNNNFDAGAGLQLPSVMPLAQLFATEDKIDHKIDLATLGFVTVKANNDYVTVNSFVAPNTTPLIQRGIDAASNGWTVNVAAGTYIEYGINVNKAVTLKGANADIHGGSASRGAESLVHNTSASANINILSDGVTINGFEFTAPMVNNAIYNGAAGRSNVSIVFNNIHNVGTGRGSGSIRAIHYMLGLIAVSENVTISDNYLNNIGNTTPPPSGLAGSADAIWFGPGDFPGTVTNIRVERNIISNVNSVTLARSSRGIYIGPGSGSIISPTVKDNTIFNLNGSSNQAIKLENNVSNALVSNNLIYDINSTNNDATGIYTNVASGLSTVVIRENSITNVLRAINNQATYNINATCNWYGYTDPSLVNPKVVGMVTYVPWLTDGGNITTLIAGFRPSATCDVTPPVITCPGEFTSGVNTDITFVGNIGMATATDLPNDAGTIAITKSVADNFAFPIGTTVVTWTARDLAGNTSTCNQNVIVTANTLSGTLMYNNVANTGMNEVVLKLTDALGNTVTHPDGTPVDNVTTATVDFNKGKYSFSNLRAGTYAVSVFFNDNLVEYVNSTDAGAVNLWSSINTEIEYVKFLAGDVAGDVAGNVAGVPNFFINGTDALRIQQYFVYGTDFDREEWSYWEKGVKIDDNLDTKPANFNVVVSGGDVPDFDIYAMVTGDFKGDYDGSYLKSASASLTLLSSNQMNVIADQEFELPLYAGSSMEVGAVSMILEFPSGLVEVQDIKVNGSEDPVSWAVKGNELRIGWYSLNPVSVAEKSSLLTMKLKASKSFNAGQSFDLALINSPLNELADRNFDVVKGATILVAKVGNGVELTGLNDNLDSQGLSLNNYPNPFKSWTTVAYTLPVDGKVTITLYNSIGQTVTSLVNGDQNAGKYSIRFDGSRLQPGMYVAKLRLINKNTEINGTMKLSIQK